LNVTSPRFAALLGSVKWLSPIIFLIKSFCGTAGLLRAADGDKPRLFGVMALFRSISGEVSI